MTLWTRIREIAGNMNVRKPPRVAHPHVSKPVRQQKPEPLPNGIKAANEAMNELIAMTADEYTLPPAFDKAAFFAVLRNGPLRHSKPSQVTGTEAILKAMQGAPLAWTAYALATAWLETNKTMQPVRESYWLSLAAANAYAKRRYDIKGERPDKARELGNTIPGDGALYMGRGYVQLTGRTNYTRAAAKTGFPLVGNPDLAMRTDIAAEIMREGMTQGWFTGRGFVAFLPSTGPASLAQFTQARRIINGLDKSVEIAGFALAFQAALIAGDWK
jgi:hypothetical protein